MDKATRPNGKRRLTRRPNSCEPCRQSKLRCDGRIPCTACAKRRRKPICKYRPQQVKPESANKVRAVLCSNWDDQTFWQKYKDIGVGQAFYERRQMVKDKRLFGQYSMARAIDRFKCLPGRKLITTPECSGLEVFDINMKSNKSQQEPSNSVETLIRPASPYLRRIYDESRRVHQLIHSGSLVEAWTIMPQLARLAQLDTLTYNPKKSPKPDFEGSEFRRRLSWSVVALDIRVSICMGRPLAVCNKLDLERPALDGLEEPYRELEQSKLDFHQYALEVLNAALEGPTPQTLQLDRFRQIESQVPKIDSNDKKLLAAALDHRIELLAFKMLFSLSLTDHLQDSGNILDSARSILACYQSVSQFDQSPNWIRLFNAYCSAAILAIAVLREETTQASDIELINTTYGVFYSMADQKLHQSLSATAAIRIGQLFAEMRKDEPGMIPVPVGRVDWRHPFSSAPISPANIVPSQDPTRLSVDTGSLWSNDSLGPDTRSSFDSTFSHQDSLATYDTTSTTPYSSCFPTANASPAWYGNEDSFYDAEMYALESFRQAETPMPCQYTYSETTPQIVSNPTYPYEQDHHRGNIYPTAREQGYIAENNLEWDLGNCQSVPINPRYNVTPTAYTPTYQPYSVAY